MMWMMWILGYSMPHAYLGTVPPPIHSAHAHGDDACGDCHEPSEPTLDQGCLPSTHIVSCRSFLIFCAKSVPLARAR